MKSDPEETIEHDIVVKMPPKRRYEIQVNIISISKAKPKIIIPENLKVK